MFYVELTRARNIVVLLTDDREALETAPAKELSALRAIGEQFEVPTSVSASAPAETITQSPPSEKPALLDEATRERCREAERFVDRILSAAKASLRERDERAREAHTHGTHVILAHGYAERREGARRALADCRKVLDDPATFGRHLDRRPGAVDEMKRLSAQIESDLKGDQAEIDRRQRRQEQRKLEQQKQERHPPVEAPLFVLAQDKTRTLLPVVLVPAVQRACDHEAREIHPGFLGALSDKHAVRRRAVDSVLVRWCDVRRVPVFPPAVTPASPRHPRVPPHAGQGSPRSPLNLS